MGVGCSGTIFRVIPDEGSLHALKKKRKKELWVAVGLLFFSVCGKRSIIAERMSVDRAL